MKPVIAGATPARELRSLALVLALLALSLSSAGCDLWSDETTEPMPSTDAPLTGRVVASGILPSDMTTTLDLGTLELGESVWLSWVLTGPPDASARFVLRLEGSSPDDDVTTLSSGPVSYGLERIENDRALRLAVIEPGAYHVTLRQVVRPEVAPGYAVEFDVLTTP